MLRCGDEATAVKSEHEDSMDHYLDNDRGNVIFYSNDTFWTMLTVTTSTIGIGLSGLALTLLFLTALLFAEWRQNYKNQLLLQFMLAKFIYSLLRYFIDVTIAFELYERSDFLIYFDVYMLFCTEMILVSWTFVFSKNMYDSLVKIFPIKDKCLWKVSVSGWCVPAVLSVALYTPYILLDLSEFSFYVSYLTMIKWPVIIANTVFLVLITKSILDNNKSRTENNSRIVVVMIVLICVFCLQQLVCDVYKVIVVLIFFNWNRTSHIMNIGFVIINVVTLYQCAFSIMFWLFGNVHTRNLWKSKYKLVTSRFN